jgi:hypothetical protein
MPGPPDPPPDNDDERLRSAAPPSGERLEDLARALADGTYRVRPDLVAEAMLRARWDRPRPRD